MSKAPLYPAFLNLFDAAVLIVGGGVVAARKAEDLLESGARVTVVSPEFVPEFGALASIKHPVGNLELVLRRYRSGDLKGKRLVFAATNLPELNTAICQAAARKNIFANCASPAEAGDFALGGCVRHGLFCLAVSTGGASASLAAHWRKRLEKLAGQEWGELAELLEKKRVEVKAAIADLTLRRKVLLALGQPAWAGKIKKLGVKRVEKMMDTLIRKM